ncbi:hypothetical protein [Pedobacter frigoris]|uniref:hypothetical protein n=1 Tax=Pedobacter frigoris TaxID=2571272 RepID=UPI002930456E|nr:hypothetical protein [Pedobacter frigoris]
MEPKHLEQTIHAYIAFVGDDRLSVSGNSGNSSEAHLHFHIQDKEDFTMATGIKCYFDKLKVNGTAETEYSPIKGDKVSLGN